MSYNIGIIKPSYHDAQLDGEEPLIVTSFTGPGEDRRWLQLSIGDKAIRLSPPDQLALYILIDSRIRGTDKEMLELH